MLHIHHKIFNPFILLGDTPEETYTKCVEALNASALSGENFSDSQRDEIIKKITRIMFDLFIRKNVDEKVFGSTFSYNIASSINQIEIHYLNEFGFYSINKISMDEMGLHGFLFTLSRGVVFPIDLKLMDISVCNHQRENGQPDITPSSMKDIVKCNKCSTKFSTRVFKRVHKGNREDVINQLRLFDVDELEIEKCKHSNQMLLDLYLGTLYRPLKIAR